MSPQPEPQVLVVGAGPAGLAAACALAEQGISGILVIDRDDAPGGLPRFCHHPGFGLEYARWPYSGPGFVKRLLRDLDGTGVRIECRTTLLAPKDGPAAEIVGPQLGHRELRPRAIILATGIREANRGNLLVPGGRAETGILTTGLLQQLVARGVPLPRRMRSAIVVGTEHVAFSAIWTARKAGLRVKAVVGSEDRVMSFGPLAALTRAVGIEVLTSTEVSEVMAENGAVTSVTLRTSLGTRRLSTDAIIFSGNWIPETAALAGGPVRLDPRTNGPEIDQAMRTSAPGIFAAGNVLRGVESSGWCANEGRHAGLMAARFLRGELGAAQAGRHVVLPTEIAFLVPQRWGEMETDPSPISLRVGCDLNGHRMALKEGDRIVWTSARRTFLRKRRIFVPRAIAAQASGRLEFLP